MFATTRAAFTDVTTTAFSVAVTALTEPIHRRSLANAREAIEQRHREDAAAAAHLAPAVALVGRN
jgi:hypothetical protein